MIVNNEPIIGRHLQFNRQQVGALMVAFDVSYCTEERVDGSPGLQLDTDNIGCP